MTAARDLATRYAATAPETVIKGLWLVQPWRECARAGCSTVFVEGQGCGRFCSRDCHRKYYRETRKQRYLVDMLMQVYQLAEPERQRLAAAVEKCPTKFYKVANQLALVYIARREAWEFDLKLVSRNAMRAA